MSVFVYNIGHDTNKFIYQHVCIYVYNIGHDTNMFIH